MMAVLAVFASNNHAALQQAIEAEFKDSSLHLGPGEWLISAPLTANEVADKIQVSAGKSGNALIVSISGYWGRQPTNVWDWLKTKLEK